MIVCYDFVKRIILLSFTSILMGIFPLTDYADAANANLFVSAENSQFDNYFSGAQVIEVVITSLEETNLPVAEPDVTVNGKTLRMTQAIDGNWYGYFADKNMALIADRTTTEDGIGLDFGYFCSNTSTITGSQGNLTVSFSDTAGFSINNNSFGTDSDSFLGSTIPSCGTITGSQTPPTTDTNNVVRETKNVNNNSNLIDDGQIGMSANVWPVIQLYSLNPTGNVVIQYNLGGGTQTTTLTFDTVDFLVDSNLDKILYAKGSQVFLTITDVWLNIDPTDEDSWTFGTTGTGSSVNATTMYQVFDENGNSVGDTESNTDGDLTAKLQNLMCEDNCRLITNSDLQNLGSVLTLQDNDDSEITATAGTSNPQLPEDWETGNGHISGNVPITITEQGLRSGIFGAYDESNNSNIVISTLAKGGATASIAYNETPRSVVVLLPNCEVPNNGVWTITEDCKLISSITTSGNIVVQNNSVLTIQAGVTLTIPSGQNITIEYGSGVLIKSGGNLRVLA